MRFLLLCLLCGLPALTCADAPTAATATAKTAFRWNGSAFAVKDVLCTPKPAWLHVLVDVFPARKDLQDPQAPWQGLALAAAVYARGLHPKAMTLSVDLVEFPERDSYGEPRWESVRKLAHFMVHAGKHGKLTAKADHGAKP